MPSRVPVTDRETKPGAIPERRGLLGPALRRRLNSRSILGGSLAAACGLAIVLGLALLTPGFMTIANAKAILLSASLVGLLAVGETVIMIGGSLFSLSIAQIAAASAMIYLPALQLGLGWAIIIAIALAVALNAMQGVAIGYWRANPIIVTIAVGSMTEGADMTLSGNRNIYPPAGDTAYNFVLRTVGGISVSVYIFLAMAVLVGVMMARTRFGMELYLLGDNRRGARAAGLSVGRLTVGAFAVAGICAGIAGLMLAAISGQAQASLAGNSTYDAIAAALVGGSAVTGGRGSIGRTVFGALVIAAVTDLALERGYSEGAQLAVKGALVLLTVIIVRLTGRSGTRTA